MLLTLECVTWMFSSEHGLCLIEGEHKCTPNFLAMQSRVQNSRRMLEGMVSAARHSRGCGLAGPCSLLTLLRWTGSCSQL